MTGWLRSVQDADVKHIVFDLDGTIATLAITWDDWIVEVLGLLPEDEKDHLRELLYRPGASWGVEYNRLLDVGLLDRSAVLAISARYEHPDITFTPRPDVVAALPELARDFRLSVWTNNLSATASRVLGTLAVVDLFDAVVGADDVDRGKPSPEAWGILGRLGTPRQSVIVGDSDNDRQAALAVGCRFVDVRI